VIATETSVTDICATRVYGTLAQQAHPDVITALAQGRR